jgi:uncharacterized protein YbaA (DUF1428 family)
MSYVDGYVIAVPNANRDKYIALAEIAAAVFKDCGATRVVECWGDDVPEGQITSFPLAVKLEPGEAVVFSWVEWPSKSVREEGMKHFMSDKRLEGCEMPFDGKRMIFGSFHAIVQR